MFGQFVVDRLEVDLAPPAARNHEPVIELRDPLEVSFVCSVERISSRVRQPWKFLPSKVQPTAISYSKILI